MSKQGFDFDSVMVARRMIALASLEDRAEIRRWLLADFKSSGYREISSEPAYLEIVPAFVRSIAHIRFWKALAGDDLSAILKGHLYVERLLDAMIQISYHGPAEPCDGSFLFFKKYQTLRRLRAIEKSDARMLEAFNKIRNEFAHQAEVKHFRQLHWDLIEKTLNENEMAYLEYMVTEGGENVAKATIGEKMRQAIFAVYARIEMRGKAAGLFTNEDD